MFDVFGNNPVAVKSYALAIEVVKAVKHLQLEKEYILSKQLMRAGTAPGALVREALQGESRADFIHKLSIALKEAHETEYWIRLLMDSGYLHPQDCPSLLSNLKEVISLLTSIIKKTKGN